MIKVKITRGKKPGTERIIFTLRDNTKVEFDSYLDARKWQFTKIFGENPDFSKLDFSDESYLLKTFDLDNDILPRLVVADPCRISNLQQLVDKLDISTVNVSDYLVKPKL